MYRFVSLSIHLDKVDRYLCHCGAVFLDDGLFVFLEMDDLVISSSHSGLECCRLTNRSSISCGTSLRLLLLFVDLFFWFFDFIGIVVLDCFLYYLDILCVLVFVVLLNRFFIFKFTFDFGLDWICLRLILEIVRVFMLSFQLAFPICFLLRTSPSPVQYSTGMHAKLAWP